MREASAERVWPRGRQHRRPDGGAPSERRGTEPAQALKASKKPRKSASGQKETLMPIEGKKPQRKPA
jgi:hypothetical protein